MVTRRLTSAKISVNAMRVSGLSSTDGGLEGGVEKGRDARVCQATQTRRAGKANYQLNWRKPVTVRWPRPGTLTCKPPLIAAEPIWPAPLT